ncbi:hypothetical protein OK18_08270 [Chryseobacterium gallinarum]|uniref:Uncharacterized protein n=1 Tax=Chryseobacterium gallinarum TaxID=1324352 RepID=A0A0G3M1W4_CHRGL|nr:hypothetical protein [Chryseobacterium gallinarum]AKK72620.1 hypothetical protein OK18_08270 [Chryseobacterium gallinarum]
MVKNIIILLSSIFFIHPYAQTRRLANGTKVLTKKYKNIDKFNELAYRNIDIDYFYKQIDYYLSDKNFNKKRDYGSNAIRKIQFYNNGRIRILGMEDPDPENAGMRGIIYLKDNHIRIDTQGASQDGDIFKITFKVKIEGDKIYLLEMPNTLLFQPSEYNCYIYQKAKKIPEDWKKYKADW